MLIDSIPKGHMNANGKPTIFKLYPGTAQPIKEVSRSDPFKQY